MIKKLITKNIKLKTLHNIIPCITFTSHFRSHLFLLLFTHLTFTLEKLNLPSPTVPPKRNPAQGKLLTFHDI